MNRSPDEQVQPTPRSAHSDRPAGVARRFFPQLEGMRAVAAIAVLTTHVSFQTGAVDTAVLGPIVGRLDLAVALFFGLSGFLLWHPWARSARTEAPRPDIGRYFRHRIVRIWPAYIVVVVLVLTLLPDAKGADLTVWLANLTLTQVFVSLSLTAGLTQMWSLSVEVAFYLLLPLIGLALVRLRGDLARLRIPAILAMGVVSLGWAWFADTLPLSDGIETKNWVFGHLPWFAAGLVLAEISASTEAAHHDRQSYPRWLRITVDFSANRRLMGAVFVVAYGLACTPLAGPTGLGEVTDLQFATKMVLGAIVAYALLAPLVCAQGPFRFLDSPVMQALGRWSYGIFIWHLAVLAIVFPLFGIIPFNGNMPLVLLITVTLTIGISAASYTFIEDPTRRWLNEREGRRRR